MDSQESAAENADFRDFNSNFMKDNESPAIPKGGFFDMVEHPSIRDDADHTEMEDEIDDEHDEDEEDVIDDDGAIVANEQEI